LRMLRSALVRARLKRRPRPTASASVNRRTSAVAVPWGTLPEIGDGWSARFIPGAGWGVGPAPEPGVLGTTGAPICPAAMEHNRRSRTGVVFMTEAAIANLSGEANYYLSCKDVFPG